MKQKIVNWLDNFRIYRFIYLVIQDAIADWPSSKNKNGFTLRFPCATEEIAKWFDDCMLNIKKDHAKKFYTLLPAVFQYASGIKCPWLDLDIKITENKKKVSHLSEAWEGGKK